MNPNLFSLREQEIFDTLKQLKGRDFVVIGGYAANAYALPRFSVDCDIVVKDREEAHKIEKILIILGYTKEEQDEELPYSGGFERFTKKIESDFRVSIDILMKEVTDRMTGASFNAEWVFENSSLKTLKGKTITEQLKVRIVDIDALLIMKMVSCRATDIRDVFMMLPNAKDKAWIKTEVTLRHDFNDRIKKIMEKVASKQFKDGLAGVYGQIDEKVFEKHRKAIVDLQK